MVDDTAHHDEDWAGGDAARALGLRTTALLVGVLLASLVAGLVVWGTGGQVAPTVADEASGCRVHPLRFTVTDDPAEFARQKRFESTVNAVPTRLLRPPARCRLDPPRRFARVRRGLRAARCQRRRHRRAPRAQYRAERTKAPVVISRRAQQPALVALSRGYALTCRQGGAPQAAEVRRFAAQEYESVADPADRRTGPAPSTPHDAPSPATP